MSMRKMLPFTKYRGIGLLELMLSLAIIAILLIMAVRYFQSASNSNAMNTAVDECNAIKAGTRSYIGSNPNADIPSVSDLVAAGYLPTSYGSGTATNPWGSLISVTPGTISAGSAPTFICTIEGIPVGLCTPIKNKMDSTLSNGESSSCGSDPATSTTFTATYLTS